MMDPPIDVLLHGVAEAALWDWEPAQRIITSGGGIGLSLRDYEVSSRKLMLWVEILLTNFGVNSNNVMTGFRQTVRNLAAARSIVSTSQSSLLSPVD
jgi:hypothetical protein